MALVKDGISMIAHEDLGTARAAGSGVAAGEVSRQGSDEKGALGEQEFGTWGTKPCLLVTMSWDCSCTLAGVTSSVLLTCIQGGTACSLCPCPQPRAEQHIPSVPRSQWHRTARLPPAPSPDHASAQGWLGQRAGSG